MSGLRIRCDALAGSLRVAVDIDLQQSWTVLFGASGSGKTSLLRLVAGLWRPSSGFVELHGTDISAWPAHRRQVGLVAQAPALFPQHSVRGNVAFGASGKNSRHDAEAMLERFGLAKLANQPVETLSGGESQRVSIARALLPRPQLLLLDESFTGMHRPLRDELTAVLRQLQAERAAAGQPMPIVSVTHDTGEAFACADEVLRLDGGHVVQRGTAAQVLATERDDLLRRLGSACA